MRQSREKFGKCTVDRIVGRGAMALVYRGWHEGLQMPVAVKVLRRELSQRNPDFASRFMREAKTAARLAHPNVVRVIDCGEENEHLYMVMDFIDGKDCLQLSREAPGAMDWQIACRITMQVAEGLGYAASMGVIHRDVKPANIIVDTTGRAVITDLGLAKLSMRGTAELTGELHTVGTPNYMSPEQIRDPSSTDLRADIYSLGATLYRLLCGRPPFRAASAMDVVAMHLTAMPVPPVKLRPDIPSGLSDIIRKMLAKSPEDRYQTYEDLLSDMQEVLAGGEVTATEFHDVPLLESDAELADVLSELDFLHELEIEDPDSSSVDFAVAPAGMLNGNPDNLALFEVEDAESTPADMDVDAVSGADVLENLDELATDLKNVEPTPFTWAWLMRKLRPRSRGHDK